jgi:hypothetical protein
MHKVRPNYRHAVKTPNRHSFLNQQLFAQRFNEAFDGPQIPGATRIGLFIKQEIFSSDASKLLTSSFPAKKIDSSRLNVQQVEHE